MHDMRARASFRQGQRFVPNSYARIDGPRVWIEVTIQGGIVYKNMVHYHTIWRDKAADYGAEYN